MAKQIMSGFIIVVVKADVKSTGLGETLMSARAATVGCEAGFRLSLEAKKTASIHRVLTRHPTLQYIASRTDSVFSPGCLSRARHRTGPTKASVAVALCTTLPNRASQLIVLP